MTALISIYDFLLLPKLFHCSFNASNIPLPWLSDAHIPSSFPMLTYVLVSLAYVYDDHICHSLIVVVKVLCVSALSNTVSLLGLSIYDMTLLAFACKTTFA